MISIYLLKKEFDEAFQWSQNVMQKQIIQILKDMIQKNKKKKKKKVKEEWLSNYQKSVKYSNTPEVEKLIPNLGNKEKYVIHYRNLQLYLSLGMKLTKVHRAFKIQAKSLDEAIYWIEHRIAKKKQQVILKKIFTNL